MGDDEKTTDTEVADDSAQSEDTTQNPPDEAREGDGQDYIDRSNIDFDPDEGLLSGTAIDGTSEIPGPHEKDEHGESDGDSDSGEPDSGSESDGSSESDDDRPRPSPQPS